MLGPIFSGLCLFPVRVVRADRRLGVSLGYPGTIATEKSTLPISDLEGELHRVLSWICLSVDLSDRPDTEVS